MTTRSSYCRAAARSAAYQAGVYEGLAETGAAPDWVAGVSIGAINAALIAGNPPERRVARLREFWDRVSAQLAVHSAGVDGLAAADVQPDERRVGVRVRRARLLRAAHARRRSSPRTAASAR